MWSVQKCAWKEARCQVKSAVRTTYVYSFLDISTRSKQKSSTTFEYDLCRSRKHKICTTFLCYLLINRPYAGPSLHKMCAIHWEMADFSRCSVDSFVLLILRTGLSYLCMFSYIFYLSSRKVIWHLSIKGIRNID